MDIDLHKIIHIIITKTINMNHHNKFNLNINSYITNIIQHNIILIYIHLHIKYYNYLYIKINFNNDNILMDRQNNNYFLYNINILMGNYL